jgi:hypothetical protein
MHAPVAHAALACKRAKFEPSLAEASSGRPTVLEAVKRGRKCHVQRDSDTHRFTTHTRSTMTEPPTMSAQTFAAWCAGVCSNIDYHGPPVVNSCSPAGSDSLVQGGTSETPTLVGTSVQHGELGLTVTAQLGHPHRPRVHTRHPAGCQQQGVFLTTHQRARRQSALLRKELGAGHA